MTRTQGQGKTKKIKSMDNKYNGSLDEYSRQQQEHREGDINSSLQHYTAAAASESLGDLGAHDVEMMMSSTQSQQQGTSDGEVALPVKNRADSFGLIPAPHEHDV